MPKTHHVNAIKVIMKHLDQVDLKPEKVENTCRDTRWGNTLGLKARPNHPALETCGKYFCDVGVNRIDHFFCFNSRSTSL